MKQWNKRVGLQSWGLHGCLVTISITAVSIGSLLLLAGCSTDQAEPEATAPQKAGKVIASWDGGSITTAGLEEQLERLPPRVRMQLQRQDRKRQYVEQQALNELLLAEGKRRGYDKDESIRAQIESLEERLVVQKVMKGLQQAPEISDEQIRSDYEKNKDLYSTTQIRASHILVKTEEEARKLLAQLRKDPGQFDALVKQHSTDSATKKRGGDLGFFGQGRMVPAFEKAAFDLENAGDISDVVKSPFGYHIIKLTDQKKGTHKAFKEVKDRIRVRLLAQARRQHVENEFDRLKKAANLKIDERALAAWNIPGTAPSPPKKEAAE